MMTPLDAAAQSEVITARAAAGLSDPAEMTATMQQAQADIAQTVASMMDAGHWDTCAACGHIRACHAPACYVDDCDGTCHFVEAQDFSAANDAALFAADQAEDWRDWRWSVGDLGL